MEPTTVTYGFSLSVLRTSKRAAKSRPSDHVQGPAKHPETRPRSATRPARAGVGRPAGDDRQEDDDPPRSRGPLQGNEEIMKYRYKAVDYQVNNLTGSTVPFAPIRLFDLPASRAANDTLVRLVWWTDFWIHIGAGSVMDIESALVTQVSVSAEFSPNGPVTDPVSPWADSPNIVSRGLLQSEFNGLVRSVTTGVTTQYAAHWRGPLEGVNTEGMRKGNGIGYPPEVTLSMLVDDPHGQLGVPDAHRSVYIYSAAMAIWESDYPPG
jgi:hypothetical protein